MDSTRTQHIDQHLEPTHTADSSPRQVQSGTSAGAAIPSLPTSAPHSTSANPDLPSHTGTDVGSSSSPTTARRRSARLSFSGLAAHQRDSSSGESRGKKRASDGSEELQSHNTKKTRGAQNPESSVGTDSKGKKRAAPASVVPPEVPTSQASDEASTSSSKRAKNSSESSSSGSRYSLRSKEPSSPATSSSAKGKGKAKEAAPKNMPKKASGSKQKRAGPSTDRPRKSNGGRGTLEDDIEDDALAWRDHASGSGDGLGFGSEDESMDNLEDDNDMMDGLDEETKAILRDAGIDPSSADLEGVSASTGTAAASGAATGASGSTTANARSEAPRTNSERIERFATASGLFEGLSGGGLYGIGLGGSSSSMSSQYANWRKGLRSASIDERLSTLAELNGTLSVATEESLLGTFSTNFFAPELIAILKGQPIVDKEKDSKSRPKKKNFEELDIDDMGEDLTDEEDLDDDEAAMQAALKMSAEDAGFGGGYGGGGEQERSQLECQILACRCLFYIMEDIPGSSRTLVSAGAVPVLVAQLNAIGDIELAEQTISTLQKMSEYSGRAIVEEGGLSALLNYLPFFCTAVQRNAVQAAANCCKNLSSEQAGKIQDCWPVLQEVLCQSDQKLVEIAALTIIRVLDSYRHNAELLESLLHPPMIAALSAVLSPESGPSLPPSVFTQLIKALSASARGSAKVTIALLEAGMTNTVYQILTGVLPPTHVGDEEGESANGQGLAGGVADMAIQEVLARLPKDQVEEALSLINEMMPPLCKVGPFDSSQYTEKAHKKLKRAARHPPVEATDRMTRQSSRADLTASAANSEPSTAANTPSAIATPLDPATDAGPSTTGTGAGFADAAAKAKKDSVIQAQQRLQMLKERPELTNAFIRAIVPVLVDVYAASASPRVRQKVLSGLTRAIAFAQPDLLRETLKSVPMASFLDTVLLVKDVPQNITSALQIVELLVEKIPEVYQTEFLRHGVVFEIEALANQETNANKAAKEAREKDKDATVKAEPAEEPQSTATATTRSGQPRNFTLSQLAEAVPEHLKPLVTTSLFSQLMAVDVGQLDSAGMLEILSRVNAGNAGAGGKKAPTPPTEAELVDATIWRARVLVAKKLFDAGGEAKVAARSVLEIVAARLQDLQNPDATEEQLREALRQVAAQFADPSDSLSTFELLQSGLIEGLLDFVNVQDGMLSPKDRRALLFEAFTASGEASRSPLSAFIKRLHETLGQLENFEIKTELKGIADGSRLHYATHRPIRLRLAVAEGGGLPKQIPPFFVHVPVLTPFRAIHSIIQGRVAAILQAMVRSLREAGVVLESPGAIALLRDAGMGPSGVKEAATQAASSTAEPSASGPSAGAGPSTSASDWPTTPAKNSKKEDPKPKRRRSARLSAQATGESTGGTTSSTSLNTDSGNGEGPDRGQRSSARATDGATFFDQFETEVEYTDEEYEAEMYEDEVEEAMARQPGERVIDLPAAPAQVGTKTPDKPTAARPTPSPRPDQPSTNAVPASSASAPAAPPPAPISYAAVVKTENLDWHLTFECNGHIVSPDDTIFGAYHKYKDDSDHRGIFDYGLLVHMRRSSGRLPGPAARSRTAEPESLEPGSLAFKIMGLLGVLHDLSRGAEDAAPGITVSEDKWFVNNKLTSKVSRQLEELMLIASRCQPRWSQDIMHTFPFLFPFELRFAFLQSDSFGYARNILRHLAVATQNRPDSQTHRQAIDIWSAHIVKRKVRIHRTQYLESAQKIFQMFGNGLYMIEVEYFEEPGTGLGPTLEFYSMAARDFALRELDMWRDEDSTKEGPYVHHPRGLFPSPMVTSDKPTEQASARLAWFHTLGALLGRVLLDQRLVSINLNPVFLKHILKQPVRPSLETLKQVDESMARSVESLQGYLTTRKEIEELQLPAGLRQSKLDALTVNGAKLDDLGLDFTLPGHDIELKEGGPSIEVRDDNLEEYLDKILDMTLGSGVKQQVEAFQKGFSTVFDVRDIDIFTPMELRNMFGAVEEDWSKETLEQAIKADHGYTLDSRIIRNLIEVMSSFDAKERTQFLQFVTGAPKLPIGGFKAMTPPFTVVRRPHPPNLRADDTLPSVMTCAQYIKLPDYSSKEVLRARLQSAWEMGSGAFLLS